jgi:hypothetical protein
MPRKKSKKSENTYSITLKEFDPRTIKQDSTIAFIGRRRSGKSFALRHILYFLRNIKYGTVISPTEEASPFFRDFIPSTFIFNKYKTEITHNILDIQKKKKKRAERAERDTTEENYFYILDDCLYDNSWKADEEIRRLFFNGRHYNILFIITMQYPLGIPPALRSNIDFVFMFADSNESNRERLYKSFGGALKTRAFFDQCMDALRPYECLVFNNCAVNNGTHVDEVSFFKASEKNDFKMGCENYWQKHYKYKNDNPSDDEFSDDDTDSDNDMIGLSNEKTKDYSQFKTKGKYRLKVRRGDEYTESEVKFDRTPRYKKYNR